MKKLQQLKNKQLHFCLILTILSTLVFSGVESLAADTTSAKTDVIPANSRIFAPQKTAASNMKTKTDVTTDSATGLKTDSDAKASSPAVEKAKEIKQTLKKETKKETAKFSKFLKAMLVVLVSSFIIFLALKLYKSFFLKKGAAFDYKKHGKSFESPKNFKEAINMFLDKTDK